MEKHILHIYKHTDSLTKNLNDYDYNYHVVCFACITLQLLQ